MSTDFGKDMTIIKGNDTTTDTPEASIKKGRLVVRICNIGTLCNFFGETQKNQAIMRMIYASANVISDPVSEEARKVIQSEAFKEKTLYCLGNLSPQADETGSIPLGNTSTSIDASIESFDRCIYESTHKFCNSSNTKSDQDNITSTLQRRRKMLFSNILEPFMLNCAMKQLSAYDFVGNMTLFNENEGIIFYGCPDVVGMKTVS